MEKAAIKCEFCNQDATMMHTFLLPNPRTNPNSNGYCKDDVSWCADDKIFMCDDCDKATSKHRVAKEKNMEWCSTFPNNSRFSHLFKVR